MALHLRYIYKHGLLGQVWIAATYDRNLSKGKILQINIPAAVNIIEEGVPTEENPKNKIPLPLRYQAHLLIGLIRIYTRKLKYLSDDINEFDSRLNTTIEGKCIDLPPNTGHGSRSHITIPESPLNMSTPRDPTLNIFGYPRPSLLMPDPTLTDPESLRSSLSPFTLPSNMLRTPMMNGYDLRESADFADAEDLSMDDIPVVFVSPTKVPDAIRSVEPTKFYNQQPSDYHHPDNPLFLEDDLATLKSSTGKKKRKRSNRNGGVIIDQVITLSDQQIEANQNNTRDIVRGLEENRKIFTSLNNWMDDEFFVPPVEQALDDYDADLPLDPEEYLESMRVNNTITYHLLRSTHLEQSGPQTRHAYDDSSTDKDRISSNENAPSTNSTTHTKQQLEGMLMDEELLPPTSRDFNSNTNIPHQPSKPPHTFYDDKTRESLKDVAYQFNQTKDNVLSFEEAFKCPQPQKDAHERQKRDCRRSKAFALAALLIFVRDGYVTMRQDDPHGPIFVEKTSRFEIFPN
ncbi:putative N terminus of Rad21 / Rec8 like protein [Blattamonas nauphoetae]|uniref:N terminus of Rad21 / Rec8 like protein n=1 Tax=Blattamonas nauphoetae TaxID=2049346 RepID=A0ABQ9WT45_9EUKA|nr:putative N terminus of Rad21 / Rec8 like protein [Blattamonas nauphoetae]